MPLDRRLFLAGAGLAPVAASASASPLHRRPVTPGRSPDEVWDVWPGRPPGGEHVALWAGRAPPPRPTLAGDIKGYARPVLAVWRPEGAARGALLVLPGGGYHAVSWDNEGASVAQRLLSTGASIYVLAYRLPGDALGWAHEADAPLADAQRAMRLIREDGLRQDRHPENVGVLGFSAGGHLAGRLLTQYDLPTYAPVDDRDRRSARPSYAGLLYAVVTLQAPYAHTGSRRALVGDDEARAVDLSVETHIRPGLAPTFLASALDDDTVDPQNAQIALSAPIASESSARKAKRVCSTRRVPISKGFW